MGKYYSLVCIQDTQNDRCEISLSQKTDSIIIFQKKKNQM